MYCYTVMIHNTVSICILQDTANILYTDTNCTHKLTLVLFYIYLCVCTFFAFLLELRYQYAHVNYLYSYSNIYSDMYTFPMAVEEKI